MQDLWKKREREGVSHCDYTLAYEELEVEPLYATNTRKRVIFFIIVYTSFLLVGNGAKCILFSVVFTSPPPATTAVFGSYLSSFYSYLALYRDAGLPVWRGFVGTKKKTSVGLFEY
jgi:hypothetical protein